MGDVIIGKFITKLDCPPDRILESAIGEVTDAIIVGWDKNGDLYFASSIGDCPEVLWLLELAKKGLLEIGDS
jgi:hypothetical protein